MKIITLYNSQSNFNQIDSIRNSIKENKKVIATLHDDFRKMFKNKLCKLVNNISNNCLRDKSRLIQIKFYFNSRNY